MGPVSEVFIPWTSIDVLLLSIRIAKCSFRRTNFVIWSPGVINASLLPTRSMVFGFLTSISSYESCIVVSRGKESRMIGFLHLFRPNRGMSLARLWNILITIQRISHGVFE